MWYRNCNLDSESGIGKHSLEALKKKAEDMKKNDEQLVVSLSFDEMAIRRNLMWCRTSNRFIGLIDRGKGKDNEDFKLATNSIVFMVCGINTYFEQPMAYFFIQTLNANERTSLVQEVIAEITKLGIKVANITFDGLKSNITMCQLLNADVKNEKAEYKTYFENPIDKSKVYIMFDPSHMIKLVRNTLGSRGCLLNSAGKKIEWSNFIELVKYSQENPRFALSHKMNKRHVLWADRKMHVRTAVETLSSSTANCLEFLMKTGLKQFSNAVPTIEFTRNFDSLWDIMNTESMEKDKDGKVFKSAINRTNCTEIFTFLTEVKDYILKLKVQTLKSKKWIRVIDSTVSTGFRGFVVNIISITAMYYEFVEQHHYMLFIATYRFSQDFLELLFGKIRTLNGYCDNPSAQQFSSAYRKLLYTADVTISEQSNVTLRCTSNILTVSSRHSTMGFQPDLININQIENIEDLDLELEEEIMDKFNDKARDPGIAHVANELELRLKRCDQIYCLLCLNVLIEDEKVVDSLCVNFRKGKPCMSVFQICKLTDSVMQMHVKSNPDFKNTVYTSVLNNIVWEEIFPAFYEGQVEHVENNEHGEDHKQFLVKFFIDEYINIVCAHNAKQITISTQKKYLRKRLKKLVHNSHQ